MRPQEQAADPPGRKRTSRRETQKKSEHDGTRAYSILTRSTTGKFPRNLQTKIVQIDDFPLTPPNDGGANFCSTLQARDRDFTPAPNRLPHFNYERRFHMARL